MIKKIFFIWILIFSLLFKNEVYSCSVPPDIINSIEITDNNWDYWFIYKYNLWSQLSWDFNNLIDEKYWWFKSEKDIKLFIKERIKDDLFLKQHEWLKIDYEFNWFIERKKDWKIIWDSILELWFDIKNDKDFEWNRIEVKYKKWTFKEISYYNHLELLFSFEDNYQELTLWEKLLNNDNIDYYVFRELNEDDSKIIYNFLFRRNELKKKNEYSWILQEKKIENEFNKEENLNDISYKDNKTLNKDDWYFWLLNWMNLQEFFKEKLNSDLWIFAVLLFSFLFWLIHWLMPWHSKMIVWSFASNKFKKKEIFLLIISITLSHTFFILIIAWIFYFLNQWLWESSKIIMRLSSLIYILFWIYFLNSLYKELKNINHWDWCSCCSNKNRLDLQEQIKMNEVNFKKTLMNWIILWCNPCLDALLLFVLFLWIWDLKLSILSVLFFSLWMWLLLWIIVILFFYWFKSASKNKVLYHFFLFIKIILWISILIVWLYWILK